MWTFSSVNYRSMESNKRTVLCTECEEEWEYEVVDIPYFCPDCGARGTLTIDG